MSLELLDWRRTVRDLYARVRATPDPVAGHALWCASRAALYGSHPASPLTAGCRLVHAPYDPTLRFAVEVAPVAPQRIEVLTGTDGVVPFERVGRVRLDGVGSLDVWWLDSYGGGIFLPLRDATAGQTSYGGGRYVLDTVKGADLGGADGRLVVDLNFAYQPSCAYHPAWACPLPPPGNVVARPVHAGELRPTERDSPSPNLLDLCGDAWL